MKARRKRDLKMLRKEISYFMEGIVPFSVKELKLLSANSISKVSRRGVSIIQKGYLSTIYQEPLFAYAIKNYPGKDQLLMQVNSKNHEYRFHFNEDHTVLYSNGEIFGIIDIDNRLLDVEGQKELAYIDYYTGHRYAAIYSQGVDLAHLNLNDLDGKPVSERAFSLFHEFKEQDSEKLIFLALYHLLLKPFLKI